MRIIIEGPDCSGKSTLADKLTEKFPDHVYVHNSLKDKKHVMRDAKGNLIMEVGDLFAAHVTLVRNNPKIIIDRLWPSEIIYGHIFRDGNVEYTAKEMRHIIEQYEPICVGCLPPKETVQEKFNQRKETEDFDTVDRVYDMYNKVFNECQAFKMFDYTKDKTEDFIGKHFYEWGVTLQTRRKSR